MDIQSLLRDLVSNHYEDLEKTIRQFKWITRVPQSGDEYLKNINIWELQDSAIDRLSKEKQEILKFIYNKD